MKRTGSLHLAPALLCGLLLVAGCGSSSTPMADAVAIALDAAPAEDNPARAEDARAPAADGPASPAPSVTVNGCAPACLQTLLLSCVPAGACTWQGSGERAWSNGVSVSSGTGPGGTTRTTTTKGGAVCFTEDAVLPPSIDGVHVTYSNGQGNPVATVVFSGGRFVATCTGTAPVTCAEVTAATRSRRAV